MSTKKSKIKNTKTIKINSKCGRFIRVPEDHPYLSQGIFKIIDLEKNTGIDLQLLKFIFQGTGEPSTKCAIAVSELGLHELAKKIFLERAECEEKVPEEIVHLFSWYELPDKLALQLLTKPKSNDLSLIVKLKYPLCHKRYYRNMEYENYEHLTRDFLVHVIETQGIEHSFNICACNGDLELMKLLVSLGVDPVAYGYAIVYAATNNHLEMVKYLVSVGVRVKAYERDIRIGNWVIINGYVEMLQYLISEGFDAGIGGTSTLKEAIGAGKIEMTKYLISLGANVEILIANGTAAMEAVSSGNLEMVKYVVSLGANIRVNDNDLTKLAAECGYVEIMKYLVSLGANVFSGDNRALKIASKKKRTEMVQYLVSLGATLESSKIEEEPSENEEELSELEE